MWSLLHRRTRPEDVGHEEIIRLPGPGYVPENPAAELWQRLCVPVRRQGLLLGFVWVTDRYGEMPPDQVTDVTSTAARVGVLLHDRLVAGERDRVLHRELLEGLLSRDAATRDEAWDEAVDRGLLDDGGHVAVLFVRHAAAQVCERARVFTLAVSLGSVESLIEQPARMTHCTTGGTPVSVPDNLLRLSIGLEDADELVADLGQALEG